MWLTSSFGIVHTFVLSVKSKRAGLVEDHITMRVIGRSYCLQSVSEREHMLISLEEIYLESLKIRS